jgi:hypothetical protein
MFLSKITQGWLISVNKRYAYHIINILFKIIKILIHFILPFAWISICKAKLLGHVLITNDVSNNLKIDTNSNFDLGYKKLDHIWTSFDYLDCVHKNILTIYD